MYLESKPSDSSREISKSLYCECRVRESFVVGRSVGLCLCSHVFSRTVAAVDTKRGNVGMCKGRSAQQESGAALSKNSMFKAGGPKIIYIYMIYYTRCALIRDELINSWTYIHRKHSTIFS